jgi:hypothetical protein
MFFYLFFYVAKGTREKMGVEDLKWGWSGFKGKVLIAPQTVLSYPMGPPQNEHHPYQSNHTIYPIYPIRGGDYRGMGFLRYQPFFDMGYFSV